MGMIPVRRGTRRPPAVGGHPPAPVPAGCTTGCATGYGYHVVIHPPRGNLRRRSRGAASPGRCAVGPPVLSAAVRRLALQKVSFEPPRLRRRGETRSFVKHNTPVRFDAFERVRMRCFAIIDICVARASTWWRRSSTCPSSVEWRPSSRSTCEPCAGSLSNIPLSVREARRRASTPPAPLLIAHEPSLTPKPKSPPPQREKEERY